MEMQSNCTLLILTYKGTDHLRHLLPTVRETIANTPDFKIDVIILDNGCHEPTRNFVRENSRYGSNKTNLKK